MNRAPTTPTEDTIMAKEISLTQLETTATRIKSYVDSKVSAVYRYKGSVAAFENLPAGPG